MSKNKFNVKYREYKDYKDTVYSDINIYHDMSKDDISPKGPTAADDAESSPRRINTDISAAAIGPWHGGRYSAIQPLPFTNVQYPEYKIDPSMIEFFKLYTQQTDRSLRYMISKTESFYYIYVDLPGYNHSDINVKRRGCKITVDVFKGDSAFEEDQVIIDNTLSISEPIEFEIPSDVDPGPQKLNFKNGRLTMAFRVIKEDETLDVEDQEPNLLKEALEEMNKED